jgi:hypothetical protein
MGHSSVNCKPEKTVTLTAGMSYVVSDDLSIHRSLSKDGVKLLIIDGEFLKCTN